ncbi:MAG: class I SAM-dependent methyltransferase [Thermoanaerobaculia bacterium]
MTPGGQDPTKRFSDRVESYARSRPGYPQRVLDVLRVEAKLHPSDVVADVGSGTGILSKMFLRAGNVVFGIEPNAQMRAAAQHLLAGFPGFRSVSGSAEATTLPDRGADFAAAGQAFHWFDRQKARAEFRRILRPPARVALLWNDRRTTGSRFSVGYERILREFGTDYAEVDHKNLGPEAFDEFFGPGAWSSFSIPNEQRLDLDGLRARLLSSSYAPAPGHARHEEMMDDLERTFAATNENGIVRMEYDTRIYLGRLRMG